MFKKLFKHDLKSVTRFVVPILLVLAALTLVGAIDGILLGNLATSLNDDASFINIMLVMLTYFILIIVITAVGAVSSVVQILVMVNYYKSTVSDEAYLTFTLPVKARDILLSKLLNSSLWSAVMTLASIISIGIIFLSIGLGTFDINDFLPSEPSTPLEPVTIDGGMIVVLILLVIFAISYFFNSQLLYFMAITFSSTITRKYKVLSAIGCVLGANAIYGILSSVVFTISSIIGTSASVNAENPYVILIVSFSIMIAILIGTSFLFFFATKYMLEKKLNLA